jgi:ankyrin repeat protein
MKRILFLMLYFFIVLSSTAKAEVLDQNAALIQAVKDGNIADIEKALNAGADINAKDNLNDVTALMWATQDNNIEIIKFLIGKGADVNVKRSNDGVTALLLASQYGYTEEANLLIDKGADINARAIVNNIEWTALMLASKYCHGC